MIAKTKGVAAIRLPSESIFSFELSIKSVLGIPLYVSPGGLAMDADRLLSLVKALDGNVEKPKQFMMTAGMNASALEHSVPEQLFSTTENPAYGISAVKALQIANNQGIPIYTINQSNINTVIPQLQLDSATKADIQNAVNAGKIVTVSKTDITYNGWIGCGYIIIDPNTGAGAYMISGGLNGGWVTGLIVLVTALLILAIVAVICVGSAGLGCALLVLLMPFYTAFQAWIATMASEQVRECVAAILVTMLIMWVSFYRFIYLPILNMPYIAVWAAINRIERACFGTGEAW